MINRIHFLPDSLLARILLILIVPTVLTQITASYIFYERHWSNVSEKMLNNIAGEILTSIYLIKENNFTNKEKIIEIAKKNFRFDISFYLNEQLSSSILSSSASAKYLFTLLQAGTPYPISVQQLALNKDIIVTADLSNGTELANAILQIQIPYRRFSTSTTYIFILWMTGTSFILTLIAIIFSRNQIRSITKLAIAAENFGKGIKVEAFKPTGALEVRKAAKAFLEMQDRIIRQVNARTEMLAGVSHDLRTPLTRMKLQLALIDFSPEIEELKKDLNEMEYMIQNYLNFAKGDSIEQSSIINLSELFKTILSFYKNYEIQLVSNIEENIMLMIKKASFQRAITNFIDNAIKYAKKTISLNLYTLNTEIIIEIEDDGPGIPIELRKEVFKPFYRIDNSRNLDNGGTGLGLSIALDGINSHGGRIMLDTSQTLGGLKIIISIPK